MKMHGRIPLTIESDDLVPLPTSHRQGLTVIAVLAALSFLSSTAVIVHLSVKLIRWHLRSWGQGRQPPKEPDPLPDDLSLGLAEYHFTANLPKSERSGTRRTKTHPNQFLVLIYNLLLADIHQSSAFLLNASWANKNAILVRTKVCWV